MADKKRKKKTSKSSPSKRNTPSKTKATKIKAKSEARSSGSAFKVIIIFAVITFIVGIIVFYQVSNHLWRDTTPVKEKGLPLEVQQRFGVVNRLVQEELQKLDLPATGHRSQEIPMNVSGVAWRMVRMEIDLPEEYSLKNVAEGFLDRMQGLEDQVQLNMTYPDSYTLELKWFIGDYPTHDLFFYQQKPLVTTVDPTTSQKKTKLIAIVIDDIGFKHDLAQEFFNLQADITFSVLPQSPFGAKLAAEALQKGKEILIHLPMEPQSFKYGKQGLDFLTTEMTDEQIVEMLNRFLSEFPGVVGANNHMGSKFTEDEHLMRVVLEQIKGAGLFFLDSRTSNESVAYKVAKQLRIPALKRDIFLDNTQEASDIERQLDFLLDVARRQGTAVAIGHPHYATLSALQKFITQMEEAGFQIVPLSRLTEFEKN